MKHRHGVSHTEPNVSFHHHSSICSQTTGMQWISGAENWRTHADGMNLLQNALYTQIFRSLGGFCLLMDQRTDLAETEYKNFDILSQMHEIVDRLFIGNAHEGQTAQGFTLFVNCTKEVPFMSDVVFRHRIPVDDIDDPVQRKEMAFLLPAAVALIDAIWSKGGRVLVSCQFGSQRAPCVVAAWLMFKQPELSCSDAIAAIRNRRPEAFFLGVVHFRQVLDDFSQRRVTLYGQQTHLPQINDVVWTADHGGVQ